MNHRETVKLLALMSAMDRRTIGDTEVMAWQGVLDDVDYADAAEAVRRHYRESDDYLMPVHVRRGAEAVRAERNKPEPSPWAPGQHGVPKDRAMPEVTGPIDEKALTPSVLDLVTRLRAMLPEGSREALMPRRVAWEREHAAYRRTQEAEPNPHYRPNKTTLIRCRVPRCPNFGDPDFGEASCPDWHAEDHVSCIDAACACRDLGASDDLGKGSFERCVRGGPHPAHLWGFNDRPSSCPGVAP